MVASTGLKSVRTVATNKKRPEGPTYHLLAAVAKYADSNSKSRKIVISAIIRYPVGDSR